MGGGACSKPLGARNRTDEFAHGLNLANQSGVYNGIAYEPWSRGPAPPVIFRSDLRCQPFAAGIFFGLRKLILSIKGEGTD